MRRRTLLTGLTGIVGGTMYGALNSSALAAGDPMIRIESALSSGSLDVAKPSSLAVLERGYAEACADFQAAQYGRLVSALPTLLSSAELTKSTASPAQAASVDGILAELQVLTSALMIKTDQDRLALLAADRATQLAADTGDVLLQARADRARGIALRKQGQVATARELILKTAADLQSEAHQNQALTAVYGSLVATAAYTAAVEGDRATATTLIAEAQDAARKIGRETTAQHTAFGPASVTLYEISIAQVLGDYGVAIDRASQLIVATIPNVERKARYWVDLAKAFHYSGKPQQCYQALLAAEHIAPDEVRYRKPIHDMAINLLRYRSADALPGIRSFAKRAGLTP